MKFEVTSKQTGTYYKNLIVKRFRENGDYISLWEVKNALCNDATDEDKLVGWQSDICEKMRVRETKSGWFLYLPETNSSLTWDEKRMNINSETYENVSSKEIEAINGITRALGCMNVDIYTSLEKLMNMIGANSGYFYRPCTVKAKKSGLKEERQDRKAWFHRWADLSKGVQQVVGIVEFDDGHVEQVRPDRIIFDVKGVEDD